LHRVIIGTVRVAPFLPFISHRHFSAIQRADFFAEKPLKH